MDLDIAYERCAEITSREAKNFAYGIKLLPAPKRRAMCAVYAMARRIDDIGDGDLRAAEKLTALAKVRKDIGALSAAIDEDPVLVALADATRQYDLPLDEFDLLIQGCEMDVNGVRYETFDDLVSYCRRVAGSVGKLSLSIFGTRYPESAGLRAEALGVALQVTNILRDVVEDRGMNRVYLPLEEARRFGCEANLSGPPDAVAALIADQIPRVEQWFASGLELLPLLDRRSRACVSAMAGIYHRLLHLIERDPGAVLRGRLSLATKEKLWVAARSLAGMKV
ncbi:MAG: squalene/phytoene synthase family protein [Acidimicrobiales bacterium]